MITNIIEAERLAKAQAQNLAKQAERDKSYESWYNLGGNVETGENFFLRILASGNGGLWTLAVETIWYCGKHFFELEAKHVYRTDEAFHLAIANAFLIADERVDLQMPRLKLVVDPLVFEEDSESVAMWPNVS